MADQKRWFKLWCSAPSDDDLLALEPAIRWAWAALGCYTKEHGTNGAVRVSRTNSVLAAQMGAPTAELFSTIARLPHLYLSDAPIRWPHGHDKEQVCEGQFIRGGDPLDGRGSSMLEEWCTRNGYVIVTWKNWNKYQEDSTARERVYALRSKRRGEERRGEENPPIVPHAVNGQPDRTRTQSLEILRFLNTKTGKSYRPVSANLNLIIARLKSGATVDDCRGVIARKVREWGTDPKMMAYLRPATLFNATKFECYIGEKGKP